MRGNHIQRREKRGGILGEKTTYFFGGGERKYN
jgi:hypothetical protein